jgi:hypothetical protein
MIKLKQLLPEISLMSGNAGSDGMEDFFYNALNNFLPKKYEIVSDWMDRREDYEWNAAQKKEQAKANELKLVNSDWKAMIDSKLPLVSKSGGYELRMKKEGKDLIFHLVDPKAKFIYEYFIGTIKTESGTRNYRINPKKGFNLNCYQIHWSNVAREHMGKGLGKLMYTMVYEYVNGLGAALVSDSMLFQGSQKMWFDFIPSIASFFGIIVEDIFFPIDKAEVTRDVMGGSVDSVVAMENPPLEIRKIANNMKGLSFKKGQYGMMRVRAGINDKISLKVGQTINTYTFVEDPRWMDMDEDNDIDAGRWVSKPNKDFQYTLFSNMVDEAPTMLALLKRMERLEMADTYDVTNATDYKDLKACIFSFNNANVIVKETGGRLVMVAI